MTAPAEDDVCTRPWCRCAETDLSDLPPPAYRWSPALTEPDETGDDR